MEDLPDGAGPDRALPVTVAFARCYNAAIFTTTACLTTAETAQFQDLLSGLDELGLIALPAISPAPSATVRFEGVIAQLSDWLAPHVVDAVAATFGQARSPAPAAPTAIMPLWAFASDGGNDDVLVTTARLWGCDLHVEALRVESDEEPSPVPSVANRFARWRAAAPGAGDLATVRVPGRDGRYVIFASAHRA